MFVASYRNTMASAKPKIVAEPERPVKAKPRPMTYSERVNAAWAAKQIADRRYEDLIGRAIAATPTPSLGRVTVKSIIRDVAKEHGFTAAVILGERRDRPVVAARHAAIIRAATERPDMSLPELGRAFGRDHTTILHALRKAGIRRADGVSIQHPKIVGEG